MIGFNHDLRLKPEFFAEANSRRLAVGDKVSYEVKMNSVLLLAGFIFTSYDISSLDCYPCSPAGPWVAQCQCMTLNGELGAPGRSNHRQRNSSKCTPFRQIFNIFKRDPKSNMFTLRLCCLTFKLAIWNLNHGDLKPTKCLQHAVTPSDLQFPFANPMDKHTTC